MPDGTRAYGLCVQRAFCPLYVGFSGVQLRWPHRLKICVPVFAREPIPGGIRRSGGNTRPETTVAKGGVPAEPNEPMQTVIQVITGGRGSLREKIMTDERLKKFGLIPTEHQRPGRPHGWAKIHSENAHGAINLEWHGPSGTLICRVVTKFGNKPNSIIGHFIDYLLARQQSRILAIHIMRR